MNVPRIVIKGMLNTLRMRRTTRGESVSGIFMSSTVVNRDLLRNVFCTHREDRGSEGGRMILQLVEKIINLWDGSHLH